jgi:hypothetical protein
MRRILIITHQDTPANGDILAAIKEKDPKRLAVLRPGVYMLKTETPAGAVMKAIAKIVAGDVTVFGTSFLDLGPDTERCSTIKNRELLIWMSTDD